MLEISRQIAPGIQFDIAGSYRYTDLLPIRTDINLIASPGTRDQYGRAIFGELRQAVLARGQPGAERREAGHGRGGEAGRQRPAGERQVLLGQPGAEARAAAGGRASPSPAG